MRHILLISLILLTSFGQSQTLYTYGGSDDDVGYCFTFNEVGGYVLAAAERPILGTSEEFSIRSIDAEGDLIWKRTYGHKHQESPYHIEQTSDHGYILVGNKWDGGYGRMDAYVMKLNSVGEEMWSMYYGGWHRDEGFSIKELNDGGFILAGFTKSDEQFSYGQLYVVKIDHLGNIIWTKDLGGSGKDYAFDIIEDADGNLVVVGEHAGFYGYSTFEFTHDDSDVIAYKLDTDGNVIWNQQYGGAENELAKQVIEAPQGGYFIIGSTQSSGSGSFDMYLIKIDDNGNEEWNYTYGDSGFEYGESLSLSGDYLYLAGSANNSPFTNQTDVMLVKVDPMNGQPYWTSTYGTSESEYGHYVRATSDGGCAVIGKQLVPGLGDQVLFIKMAFNGDIEVLDGSDENSLHIFPNPANDVLNIYYQLGEDCTDFGFEIYDMNGNVVYDRTEPLKFHQIDVSKWAGGEYHLKITSSCTADMVRKIIVHQ